MTQGERLEMIGQIIDGIEDWLDADYVAIDGDDYDTLFSFIEETLINWGLLEREGE